MAKFESGQSGNPAGKAPGTPNRVTAKLREAIQQSFEEAGGVQYLTKLAQDEPGAYAALLAKTLPRSVQEAIAVPDAASASGLTEKGQAIIGAALRGDVAPDAAAQLVSSLLSLANVTDVDAMQRRLETLEARLEELARAPT